jgi:hypothetical protein
MELETGAANVEPTAALTEGVAQLIAAAAQLERAAAVIEARFSAGAGPAGGDVAKVVAAVEFESSPRLAELELKLQAAEQKIAELRAQANGPVIPLRRSLRARYPPRTSAPGIGPFLL